jgi:hypothetical protein
MRGRIAVFDRRRVLEFTRVLRPDTQPVIGCMRLQAVLLQVLSDDVDPVGELLLPRGPQMAHQKRQAA